MLRCVSKLRRRKKKDEEEEKQKILKRTKNTRETNTLTKLKTQKNTINGEKLKVPRKKIMR